MKNIITFVCGISLVLALTSEGFAAQKKKAAPAKKSDQTEQAAPSQKAETKTTEKKAWSRPYGMAGCGLGTYVVGKKHQQVFGATTNGTFANQLFGITFGTLNCIDDPNAQVAQRVDNFVAANKVAIASDVARGGGETLASLSNLMGCEGVTDSMGIAMKQNFRGIFPDETVAPNEITDSIITVIRNDQNLSAHCKKIS